MLKALATRHRQLTKMRAAEKNRLSSAPAELHPLIQSIIEALNAQVQPVERKLAELLKARYADLAPLLQSVPGVGPTTTAVLLANLPELGQLTRREISALVGLAPINRDCGAMRGKRTIFGGRAHVRHCLYLAAMAAVRWNPVIRSTHQRLKGAGKPGKVSLVACARKLLLILNAIAKHRTPWNPHQHSSLPPTS